MFCDRCFKEYEDDEVVQFDRESPMWICLPCKWEFDDRLKNFLIEFFNSQSERLNPEDIDSAWVKWKDLQPPKGVKGILIRFDNGRVWTDAHYYGYDEYRKKTVGDAMPVSWTFMDRKDPSEKSIHTVST